MSRAEPSPRAADGGTGVSAGPATAEAVARLARAGLSFDDDELAAVLPVVGRRIAGLRRLADALTPTDAPMIDVLRDDLR